MLLRFWAESVRKELGERKLPSRSREARRAGVTTGEAEGSITEWRFARFVIVELSSPPMEVIGTGVVANVSDLRPLDDLGVGVKGVGRLKFSFPSDN